MNQREGRRRTLRHALPELDPKLWSELQASHLLLARTAVALERACEARGQDTAGPTRAPDTAQPPLPPCCTSPLRCLVLALLCRETRLGVTPSRLARLLAVRRSSLAHHLDVLERAGLILRSPRRIWDGRKVAVRLTAEGAAALERIQAALTDARSGAGGVFAGRSARPRREWP